MTEIVEAETVTDTAAASKKKITAAERDTTTAMDMKIRAANGGTSLARLHRFVGWVLSISHRLFFCPQGKNRLEVAVLC